MFVEGGPSVILGKNAPEARIVAFESHHGVIDNFADGGLLGVGLQKRPARVLRNPEDMLGPVFVRILGIGSGIVTLP
jgi:hypothetical protein